MAPSPPDITALLTDWRQGNRAAFDQLIPLVYDELRRLAKRHRQRQPPGQTLQTTALVHEAYLRLVAQPNIEWQDRLHFFAVAANAMRFLLVDHARARQRAKRGGGAPQVTLDEGAAVSSECATDLLALDEALNRLSVLDPRKGRIVELRYFGGLSAAETAEVLGVSEITVKREWLSAKAWLYRELQPGAKG